MNIINNEDFFREVESAIGESKIRKIPEFPQRVDKPCFLMDVSNELAKYKFNKWMINLECSFTNTIGEKHSIKPKSPCRKIRNDSSVESASSTDNVAPNGYRVEITNDKESNEEEDDDCIITKVQGPVDTSFLLSQQFEGKRFAVCEDLIPKKLPRVGFFNRC